MLNEAVRALDEFELVKFPRAPGRALTNAVAVTELPKEIVDQLKREGRAEGRIAGGSNE